MQTQSPIHILLVEDDAVALKVTAAIFEKIGYRVSAVENGEDAISRVKELTIDLILMDLDLGTGIDGAEAARTILSFTEMPIVFITNHTEEKMVSRIDGINHYGLIAKNSGAFILRQGAKMAIDLFRAHQKTRESQQRYMSLVENLPFAITELDQSSRVIIANKAMAHNLNTTVDQMTGRSIGEFLPEEVYKHRFEVSSQAVNENRIIEFEDKRNGRYINNIVVPVNDAGSQNAIVIARDVTEQRKIEQEVISNREKLETVTENALDAIVMVNQQGRVQYWNPAAERILGYSSKEMLGKDVHEKIVPEEYRERMIEGFSRFAATGKGHLVDQVRELKAVTKTGDIIPVEISISTINMQGETWATAIVRDITERKDRESFIETIFAKSSDAMIIVDLETMKITQANPVAIKLSGYSQAKLKTMSPLDLELNSDELKAENILKDLESKDKIIFETSFRNKASEEIPVEVKLQLLEHHGKKLLFHSIRDIRERKEQQRELTLKEHAVNSSLSAIAFADLEGKLSFINKSFLDLWGYSSENEVLGRPVLDFWSEPQKARQIVEAIMTSGSWSGELLGIRKDTSVFQVQLVANNILDESGKPLAMMASFLDVTERINAQKLVQEQKEEALILMQEAQEANRAKSEFLANMSHEIRTPLNSIIGFTDLLLKSELSETQRQYMTNVNSSGETLMDLINDILDYSKIEAGKLELDRTETNLIDLLERTMELIKYKAHSQGVELLLNIEPGVPHIVKADQIRLRQVLTNLLSNAVKFTSAGEIELSLCIEGETPKEVTFLFSVRDTGIGIRHEDRERIFESFAQADSSTTRQYGGTGLGLSISQQILKKMNSELKLESEFEKGSTFYFSASLEKVHAANALAEPIKDISNVLIVDDNEHNRVILQEMLKFWSITSEQVESSRQALEKLSQSTYDLLVLDYHMPVIDGYELLLKIRNDLKLSDKNQPVIVLTSAIDNLEQETLWKNLQVRAKLVKPVKMTELYETLRLISTPDFHKKELLVGFRHLSTKHFSQSKNLHILIAEDNIVNMKLVNVILTKNFKNLTIIEAITGTEAIDKAIKEKPDIILMDINMPDKDGYDATREIRKYEAAEGINSIPIIALTARAAEDDARLCLEAGMSAYLAKPVKEDILIKKIKEWLQ